MALSKEYTYAFDDSGGIEPLLNKKREFVPGDHPFFLIAAIGLNNSLLDEFREEWQRLRADIQAHLKLDALPALHARLMFGDKKPPMYRGAPNPYLTASRDEVLGWYMRGIGIISRFLKIKGGGDVLISTYHRDEIGKWAEAVFQQDVAQAEAEYLKLADRKRFPKLHQKYVAHVSAALTRPTLDIFICIQETMRQSGNNCAVILDSYNDSDGFNDSAAFGFLNENLRLSCISTVQTIADSDQEPLLQAADLVAYGHFRTQLAHSRGLPLETWGKDVATLLKSPSLCALNIPLWIHRHIRKPEIGAVYLAARYAIAHHALSQYAPEFVQHALQTPTDFLSQLQVAQLSGTANGNDNSYLPILKNGVLDAWQASRTKNGEDRSKSGPVSEE